MTTIVLVRHGENDWVKKQRLAGWIPGVHLNENGYSQANEAANRLATVPVTAVYSSPVTRCMETAEQIAKPHQLDIVQLDDLGEVRYGQWEGKKIKKLSQKKRWFTVQFFPSRLRFPDGESLREVQFRAVQALETLNQQHPEDVIIVVSHADLIKLILAHYLGIHIDLFQRLTIAPASISVIDLHKQGSVRVLRINDNGPLKLPTKPKKKRKTKEKKGKAAAPETAADSQNSIP